MKNLFKKFIWILTIVVVFSQGCQRPKDNIDDLYSYAKTRTNDLQLSIYITAQAIDQLLTTEMGKREAISIFRANGITKAVLESYRGGLVVDKTLLIDTRDFFRKNGIEVIGGIATVPGPNFGVHQEAQLGWFNWQNPKTQKDLKEVVEMSAEVFDEFIVDDFLCTADTSLESKQAKGDKSWSQYRRDLLTQLSKDIFIEPAKKINPNIKMIIKYPQWYDRFHLFGYELAREPQLYDKVWVGTESRGQYTQRYGFVQTYEGFVNYRWIKDIVKEKISGAWFDHGDCDENDFIEQAYQAITAGAKEIIFFNYFDFVNGHKGHHLLRNNFTKLADLAKNVAKNNVQGIAGYKPINSDAGSDLYLMDFIGTLGIPLVPVHNYPEDAKVIFLPTQAASDSEIYAKVNSSLAKGSTIIFTTGFLAKVKNGEQLAKLAGIKYPINVSHINAKSIVVNNKAVKLKHGLDLESNLTIVNGKALLNASAKSNSIPLLVKSNIESQNIYTLNTHTFSQADFDKVGEVLLCPRELGLLEIPQIWANEIRSIFNTEIGIDLDAPTRVSFQPLGSTGWIIHNYNKTEETISFSVKNIDNLDLVDGFSDEKIKTNEGRVILTMKPRSRTWIKIK